MDWFPSNLAHLIKTRKIVADDVAKIVGSSDGTISNWRKSVSKPRFTEILRLMEYFDLSFEKLFLEDLANSNLIENSNKLELTEAAEPQVEYAVTKVFEPHVGDLQGNGCSMSADGSCVFRNQAKLNETLKRNEELERRLAVLERQAKRKK